MLQVGGRVCQVHPAVHFFMKTIPVEYFCHCLMLAAFNNIHSHFLLKRINTWNKSLPKHKLKLSWDGHLLTIGVLWKGNTKPSWTLVVSTSSQKLAANTTCCYMWCSSGSLWTCASPLVYASPASREGNEGHLVLSNIRTRLFPSLLPLAKAPLTTCTMFLLGAGGMLGWHEQW